MNPFFLYVLSFLVSLILSPFVVLSEENNDPTASYGLKVYKDTQYGFQFWYDPTRTKILRDLSSPCGDESPPCIVAEFKATDQSTMYVFYSIGPSDDFAFWVTSQKDYNFDSGSQAFSRPGEQFIILNTGDFIIKGGSNLIYPHTTKYKISNQKIEKVAAPFDYIGLETLVCQHLTLVAEPDSKQVVAEVKPQTKITILLAQDKKSAYQEDPSQKISDGYTDFLIKTPLGLLGWYRLSDKNVHQGNYDKEVCEKNSPPLMQIFYHGD